LVTQTHIIDILAKMLCFEENDDTIYFMKLEALWSLNNIACGDDSIVRKMLIEGPGQIDDVYYSLDIGLL